MSSYPTDGKLGPTSRPALPHLEESSQSSIIFLQKSSQLIGGSNSSLITSCIEMALKPYNPSKIFLPLKVDGYSCKVILHPANMEWTLS